MRALSRIACCGLAASALLAGGCSGDSGEPSLATGKLSVYYADAAGNVSELNVKFKQLAIYDTSGQKVTLTMADADPAVNLIAAKDDPQLLKTFNIPAGDYNGIEGSFEVVNFKVADDPFFCLVAQPTVTIPKLIVAGAALRVNDAGVSVVVDIPVVSGNCPAAGEVGTVQFGSMSILPRP